LRFKYFVVVVVGLIGVCVIESFVFTALLCCIFFHLFFFSVTKYIFYFIVIFLSALTAYNFLALDSKLLFLHATVPRSIPPHVTHSRAALSELLWAPPLGAPDRAAQDDNDGSLFHALAPLRAFGRAPKTILQPAPRLLTSCSLQ
jgi:hypothetical protein